MRLAVCNSLNLFTCTGLQGLPDIPGSNALRWNLLSDTPRPELGKLSIEKATMKLEYVKIENFRSIREEMRLPLHPRLTVLVGDNANGKTTVLDALATGLGIIPTYFGVKGRRASSYDIHQYAPKLDKGFILDKSGLDELQQTPYMRITLKTLEGVLWDISKYEPIQKKTSDIPKGAGHKQLNDFLNKICLNERSALPVVAYYGTNRAISSSKAENGRDKKRNTRFYALDNSLAGMSRFNQLKEWFAEEEDVERRKRLDHDQKYRSPMLQAVRKAVENLLPGCGNLRTIARPTRLLVDFSYGKKEPGEILLLEQLSDGYRTLLAVAADLARRMAIANPHLQENVLQTEAIILIDEIDLHLHPNWQQQVVAVNEDFPGLADDRPANSLLEVFPNAQFIVTTHSDELLTSVKPENIIRLFRNQGTIHARSAVDSYTYGAKSGKVLERVMEGSERPPHNLFTILLNRYYDLIEEDEWDGEEAEKIKQRLYELSPDEPELISIRMEIRRRRAISGKSNDEKS